MARRERDILERSVHAIAEQAANINKVIDEAMEAGLGSDHAVTIAAKQVRLELLKVKADLERELGKLVLSCRRCGTEVHWVQVIGMSDPGHWGRRSPGEGGAARRAAGRDRAVRIRRGLPAPQCPNVPRN